MGIKQVYSLPALKLPIFSFSVPLRLCVIPFHFKVDTNGQQRKQGRQGERRKKNLYHEFREMV
jgi:hypothetical protein